MHYITDDKNLTLKWDETAFRFSAPLCCWQTASNRECGYNKTHGLKAEIKQLVVGCGTLFANWRWEKPDRSLMLKAQRQLVNSSHKKGMFVFLIREVRGKQKNNRLKWQVLTPLLFFKTFVALGKKSVFEGRNKCGKVPCLLDGLDE